MKYKLLNSVFFLFFVGYLYPQTNVALDKPYTLSSSPNYRFSDAQLSEKLLTDGVKKSKEEGSFWTKKTTAGWTHKQAVTIEIDLEQTYPISEICFNTVKRIKSGIYFPAHIFVYLSENQTDYYFAGDMMDNQEVGKNPYQVINFNMTNIGVLAKYIKIVVVPQGKFVFCDEIKVMSDKSNKILSLKKANYKISTAQITEKVNKALVNQKNGLILNKTKKRLTQRTHKSVFKDVTTSKDLKETMTDYLSNNFDESFVVNQVSPWEHFHFYDIPEPQNSQIVYDVTLPTGLSRWRALKITNTSSKNIKLSLSATENSASNITFFLGEFVTATHGRSLDPLLFIAQTGTINIQRGESKVLFIKLTGTGIGKDNSEIVIRNEQVKKVVQITTETFHLKEEKQLNAINWAFLNKPLLADRRLAAIEDLERHYINSFVSPTKILGWIGHPNVDRIRQYFANINRKSNLVLYYNLKNNHQIRTFKGQLKYMGTDWKAQFLPWYREILKTLVDMGFKADKIYFYPFDEPSGKSVDEFIAFSNWTNKAIPEMNLFVTALKKDALKLKDYTDILVVSDRLDLDNIKEKMPSNTWFYSIISHSRGQSAYKDYRLMAWEAFYLEFDGIGFWNYAAFQDKSDNLINSHYLKGNKDYSVVYTKGEEIITSRRWEAFSQGLEDYQIITAFAQKFGRKKALVLAEKVLENKENILLADAVLNEILQKLK